MSLFRKTTIAAIILDKAAVSVAIDSVIVDQTGAAMSQPERERRAFQHTGDPVVDFDAALAELNVHLAAKDPPRAPVPPEEWARVVAAVAGWKAGGNNGGN